MPVAAGLAASDAGWAARAASAGGGAGAADVVAVGAGAADTAGVGVGAADAGGFDGGGVGAVASAGGWTMSVNVGGVDARAAAAFGAGVGAFAGGVEVAGRLAGMAGACRTSVSVGTVVPESAVACAALTSPPPVSERARAFSRAGEAAPVGLGVVAGVLSGAGTLGACSAVVGVSLAGFLGASTGAFSSVARGQLAQSMAWARAACGELAGADISAAAIA